MSGQRSQPFPIASVLSWHMTTSDEEALQEKEAPYIQVMTQEVPSSQKKGRFPTFDNVAWTF